MKGQERPAGRQFLEQADRIQAEGNVVVKVDDVRLQMFDERAHVKTQDVIGVADASKRVVRGRRPQELVAAASKRAKPRVVANLPGFSLSHEDRLDAAHGLQVFKQ